MPKQANRMKIIFADASTETLMSPPPPSRAYFRLSSIMFMEWVGLDNICRPGLRPEFSPHPLTAAGQCWGGCPLGEDGSFRCLPLLTKEKYSCCQIVFQGDVAKIITRVW